MSREESSFVNPYSRNICKRHSRKAIISDDSSDESDHSNMNNGTQVSPDGNNDQMFNNSIITMSSAKQVSDVVSKFNEYKRNIVRSIGFGSILELPDFHHSHSSFYFWLLSNVKWYQRTFRLNERFNIKLTPEHICKIIGLSSTGGDVTSKAFENDNEKRAFIKSRLAFLGTEYSILPAAEKFVNLEFNGHLSSEQCENFKIAFVIFVMGRFLAPSTETNWGHTDFWGALHDPDQIANFNWSSYVLLHIMEAARAVRWSSVKKTRVTHITGCSLILQILYLDNIDFGMLNLAHDTFPRVKHFSSDWLKNMVQADIVEDPNKLDGFTFGRNKVIRSENNCYISCNQALTTGSGWTHSTPSNGMSNRSENKHQYNIEAYPVSNKSINISVETRPSAGCAVVSNTTVSNNHIITSNPSSTICPSPKLHDAPALLPTPAVELDNSVIDFSKLVRDRYQGQVDDVLLDDLKYHNARCLSHIHSFTRALKSAITKENANLAIKYIEHHVKISGGAASTSTSNDVATRRRKFDDSNSTPVTEHEDLGSKSPLANNGILFPSLASKQKQPRLDGTANNVLPAEQVSVTKPVASSLPGHPITNFLPLSKVSSSRNCSFRDKTPVAEPEHSHYSLFKTPTPTVKLGPITPTYSATAENNMYSGVDLSLKMFGTIKDLDLNDRSIEGEYSISPSHKKICQTGTLATTHWEMGKDHPEIDMHITKFFFNWLSTTSSVDLKRAWIIHQHPRFIQLIGDHLRDVFASTRFMSDDVFDIAIRRMKQLDRMIYQPDTQLRWRHIFESDFAMNVLSKENGIQKFSVREQFVGEHIEYELSRCRMFFVPVLVKETWCAYAWDCGSNKVFIIDPLVAVEDNETVLRRHRGTIATLEKSLSSTISDLFDGWSPKFTCCTQAVLRVTGKPCSSLDTGFFTLFCIKNFNGDKLISYPTETNLQKFKEYML